MDIRDIRIDYASFNGFSAIDCDKVRHVKVLPYLSVVQAVEGHYGIALGNGATHSTGDGGFFVAPAGVQQTIVHNADAGSGRMTCRWVFLQVKLNGVSCLDERFDFPTVLPSAVRESMNAVFDELFAADDTVDRYIAYYRIVKLLLSVGRPKTQERPSYIAHATAFIRDRHRQTLCVKEIADHVNLSPSRLFSLFKEQMGVSPIAYLNAYRLSLAVELLTQTERTVTEIAADVGIHDAVYFNKLFRKSYRMSPTAYRALYKG